MLEKFKKKIRIEHIALFGCLILAAFFMLDHVSVRSFWSDEAGVAILISKPFSQIYKDAINDAHPLFYIYAIKCWSLIFGYSELALRGFSMLFALILIVAVFKIGSELFNSRGVGILAAFVISTNYFLIWFGAQNKAYTLAALLALLSYYFFIRVIQQFKKNTYLPYLVFMTIGLYTHPWLFFVFISQVVSSLFLWVDHDLRSIKIFLIQISIAFLFFPGFLITLYQGSIGASAWIQRPDLSVLLNSFKFLSHGSSQLYILISLLTGIFIFFREDAEKEKIGKSIGFLALYLFFPLLCAFFISQINPCYVLGRYEMIVLPAFILLLSRFWSNIENKYVLFLITPLFVLSAYRSVIADREIVQGYQTNDKVVAQNLIGRIHDGDIIVTTDLSYATMFYYLNRANVYGKKFEIISYPKEIEKHPGWKNISRMIEEREKYEKEANEVIYSLKPLVKTGKRVYVLYKINNPVNEILYNGLEQNFALDVEVLEQPRQPMWFDIILTLKENLEYTP